MNKCPLHNTLLEQVNIKFENVGYCRECQKEYYRLPDGKIVDRKEFFEFKREFI